MLSMYFPSKRVGLWGKCRGNYEIVYLIKEEKDGMSFDELRLVFNYTKYTE